MPELPEVEVLSRHLAPNVRGRAITAVKVLRAKVVAPTRPAALARALKGATITDLTRRGKFLLFHLVKDDKERCLLGHLGMTGRMFVQDRDASLPQHTAVHLELGDRRFVYQDTRYFGRFTLDLTGLERLGPEPHSDAFAPATFRQALRQSKQAIKVKLLDQALVAGVGNIYASEALHRARVSPRKSARRVTKAEGERLWRSIRSVLAEAIECGSTIPLDFTGGGTRDGLFYYGAPAGTEDFYEERLLVYDREGEPCVACGTPIRRIIQAARSTFFCPSCQRA